MKMDTINKWLTFGSNIGVIVGIIFLAIEVSQNTTQTKLQTTNDYLGTFVDIELSMAANNELLAALVSSQQSQELSEIDKARVQLIHRTIFRHWQTAYYQNKTGLLDPAIWEAEKNQIKQTFGFDPGVEKYWRANLALYTPEYNAMIERLIK